MTGVCVCRLLGEAISVGPLGEVAVAGVSQISLFGVGWNCRHFWQGDKGKLLSEAAIGM